MDGKGNEWTPFCCSSLHLCLLQQSKHHSFIPCTFCFDWTARGLHERSCCPLFGAKLHAADPSVTTRDCIYSAGVNVVSCELPPVGVCHFGPLGDFICHGRCPYTTTPRGEIRHAARLSLPLSIIAFALASLHLSPPTFPHSLPVRVPVLHLTLSLLLPSELRRAAAVNRVTGVETAAPPGSVMQRADGPLCPFSRNADRLQHGRLQSLPTTPADRSASKVMSHHDAL